MKVGKILKVSGPLVVAQGMDEANVYDVVEVSEDRLIGEIIEMRNDRASIQVYENTTGIGPGEPVYTTGSPLSIELGPGLIEGMFDGIQRPLDALKDKAGDFLTRGITVPRLNREKKWDFVATKKVGDKVQSGDIIGEVQENKVFKHKIMVPIGLSGTIKSISSGSFTVDEVVAKIDGENGGDVKLMQKWPVRVPRPVKEKLDPIKPLITGQRVIDTFFPVAKGGTAAIPGPLDQERQLFSTN